MAWTISGPRTIRVAQPLHRDESTAFIAVLVHRKVILELSQSNQNTVLSITEPRNLRRNVSKQGESVRRLR